ncbi:D-alanyl-D-alanine dipeptidase superfamily [Synechococcus sp. PCC 7335]|uniref:M15 family metallopeptidase n=1 Tax=Synechococcus sp. (strain ATCC 29403 / PCC 7335) TaxID=91464 RepID=UPI00017EB860|nr:M15 family metallopeptidase [Synechococcus sp. PCC 7335]EDX86928.1 D-alanyl-D-alanine dipeptidase superfamily [Synechococcus sp. PCC 7335]
MKPYQKIPIQDCKEPITAIPLEQFTIVSPHPYQSLGAPYGDYSPYFLRLGVLEKLLQAQRVLRAQQPGWHLQIFDAYRPVAVQQFMVNYTFDQLVRSKGLDPRTLNEEGRSDIQAEVLEFWAVPSLDPKTPPPHSTGSAIDLSLTDATGRTVDMGSPIDEISPRSYPQHFADSHDIAQQQAHYHRSLLAEVMATAGFVQHPKEWWHFSVGDQLWAWQVGKGVIAYYGDASQVI